MVKRCCIKPRDSFDILPFYEWKAQRIKKDGFFHYKDWYYEEYGRYCNKQRALQTKLKDEFI